MGYSKLFVARMVSCVIPCYTSSWHSYIRRLRISMDLQTTKPDRSTDIYRVIVYNETVPVVAQVRLQLLVFVFLVVSYED